MRRADLLLWLTLGACCASAATSEFRGLVDSVSQHYGVEATHIPMMSFISLCARLATHGGVHRLRVAEFDHLNVRLGVPELAALVRQNLGNEWQPFVTERDRHGDDESVIFVHPVGQRMDMVIAEYDHGELDVVAMELHGKALADWVENPKDRGSYK